MTQVTDMKVWADKIVYTKNDEIEIWNNEYDIPVAVVQHWGYILAD